MIDTSKDKDKKREKNKIKMKCLKFITTILQKCEI